MAVSLDPDVAAVYVDETGHIYYRASAVGGCLTSLVAARLKYVQARTPATVQKGYDRGHQAEVTVKNKMREEGWAIWDEQLTVELPITSTISVVGHIDGKVGQPTGIETVPMHVYLGEVKSQSEDEWRKFSQYGWDGGFFPRYKWQVSTYMHVLGLPLAFIRVCVNKNGEIIGLKVEYFEQPFHSIADIRMKVLAVEMLARELTIPQCDKPIFGCPYFYLPEHKGEDEGGERVLLTDESFEEVCVEYKRAQIEAKHGKDEVERLRPLIDQQIVDKVGTGAQKITTDGGVKVTKYQQNNPPFVEYDRMVEDGVITPDVKERYTKQTKGWRLRITVPDGYQAKEIASGE